jgi:hypothetical protein
MGMPVEKKETRTWPIVGTIVAIVIGLIGLLCLCPISILVFLGAQNNFQLYFSNWYGILPCFLSIVLIAIAVVVPILLLRKKKVAPEAVVPIDVYPPQPPLPPLPPQNPPEPPMPPMPPQDPLPPTS